MLFEVAVIKTTNVTTGNITEVKEELILAPKAIVAKTKEAAIVIASRESKVEETDANKIQVLVRSFQ